jgi:(2Fe-2S) ferredoxin
MKGIKMSNMTANPDGYFRLHVFCCTNLRPEDHPLGSCAGQGSVELHRYMKDQAKRMGLKNVRINSAGCLSRCKLGPVIVVYPDNVWYHMETTADVDEILQTHVVNGGRVERLLLADDA